jgi:glycosyltransferase involved in cell wall biosynthesis
MWSPLDAERVRAVEDRLRIERVGARLDTETPLHRATRKLSDSLAKLSRTRRGAPPRSNDPGPRLHVADRDRSQLCIELSIASPSNKMAARWGDWHLAAAFARSLERAGHVATVQTAERDTTAAASVDVRLVIRGRQPLRRVGTGAHVLWVISHPDELTDTECRDADLVAVASTSYAERLRERTSTPVEVMLQATDHHRFRPLPIDAVHRHEVVAVAKTRDVPRPIVIDAIAAGLRPAIYGSGWEAFVDPALVIDRYVPNNELPRIYSSAGVVLNDHWESMRRGGFVSNRLFDALACGAPVVSDHMVELDELFGDAVRSYGSVDELRSLVEECLREPDLARERAARGRALVLAGHTFDHRVSELEEHLRRHVGAGTPDG